MMIANCKLTTLFACPRTVWGTGKANAKQSAEKEKERARERTAQCCPPARSPVDRRGQRNRTLTTRIGNEKKVPRKENKPYRFSVFGDEMRTHRRSLERRGDEGDDDDDEDGDCFGSSQREEEPLMGVPH